MSFDFNPISRIRTIQSVILKRGKKLGFRNVKTNAFSVPELLDRISENDEIRKSLFGTEGWTCRACNLEISPNEQLDETKTVCRCEPESCMPVESRDFRTAVVQTCMQSVAEPDGKSAEEVTVEAIEKLAYMCWDCELDGRTAEDAENAGTYVLCGKCHTRRELMKLTGNA